MTTPLPKYTPLTQLNIRLPEQLHRDLKKRCIDDNDRSLANAVEELVRAYVAGKVKLPPGYRQEEVKLRRLTASPCRKSSRNLSAHTSRTR